MAKRKPAPKRAEKLDPFKAYIVGRIMAALPDRIPATVLCSRDQRAWLSGWRDACGSLFVRGLTQHQPRRLRFASRPRLAIRCRRTGRALGAARTKLSLLIATLWWSGQAYVEFCDDELFETMIGCHETAFLTFGGVPVEVLYDNMKTVVIERNTYGLGVHRFHAGFLDYARHAGFLPRLCQPYRAQTKGKVERFIGYLKRSFWVPLLRRCDRLA